MFWVLSFSDCILRIPLLCEQIAVGDVEGVSVDHNVCTHYQVLRAELLVTVACVLVLFPLQELPFGYPRVSDWGFVNLEAVVVQVERYDKRTVGVFRLLGVEFGSKPQTHLLVNPFEEILFRWLGDQSIHIAK